jgi:hypothetical protein
MRGALGMRSLIGAVAGCLVVAGVTFGDGVTPQMVPSGYASFGLGQIVNGTSDQPGGIGFLSGITNPEVNHVLLQRMFVGFNLETKFAPLPIQTNLGVEMEVFNETPFTSSDNGLFERLFDFTYLTRADFIYSPCKEFNLDFGYFPFKYNPDARNLGEYLFRTGTYPQYIQTNFDFPMARLTGLCMNGTPTDGLTWDVLLTMNTEYSTMGDLNLTGIFAYKPVKLIEVGGGVSFCSLISASSDRTQPTYNSGAVGENADDEYNPVITATATGHDTSYSTYTFAGTKLMGRISIDPKQLLPDEAKRLFGDADCKIYGEATVLGVKDYPVSIDGATDYSDRWKRTPVMFGFNFPTFKLLDVLSIEGEYFGSDYPDDMTSLVVNGVPVPLRSGVTESGSTSLYADSASGHWKWSVYAKKTFVGHFNIVAQVARDHYRYEFGGDYASEATYGMLAALTKPGDFYYIAKVGYDF